MKRKIRKINSPTVSDLHVNRPLTNMSVAYLQDESSFIAGQVFPVIPVQKKSDIYYIYSRADFNRDEMEERADATESSGSGYDLSTAPYYAKVWAHHKDVSDQQRGNTDDPLDQDRDATIYVTQKALIRRERLFATQWIKAGVWGTEYNGVASGPDFGTTFLQWNDAASTPIEDVRAYKRHMREKTGFEPNKLVLGRKVYDALLDHPDLLERIKYSSSNGNPAMVSKALIAQLFEVDEVVVANAVYNAGAKGKDYASSAALESSQFIVGPHAMLIYSNPAPSIMQPSAGYILAWNGWFGATKDGYRIKRFRMENIESDRIEIQMAFAMHQVATDMGVFLNNVIGASSGSTL